MSRSRNLVAALATLGFALTAVADDDDRDRSFKARLSGFNEVHFSGAPPATLRGAVSTKARGTFRATLDRRSDVIHYKLSYEGLEGTITQAHIHFGQHHSVGGITVWLCQTNGTPAPPAVAGLTPQCVQEGTVSGTITPGQVLAAAGQGLDAGEFNELLRAMRAGATYANVHSSLFPPGEIRGQIRDDD
jgi:hypothetical protein